MTIPLRCTLVFILELGYFGRQTNLRAKNTMVQTPRKTAQNPQSAALPPPAARDINDVIARRVRILRAERALSLEVLSEQCGVSRAMLSLIERGECSPTAILLERVAGGLGVSLSTLFVDTAAPSSPLSHARDRRSWKDPLSGYLRRNISPANFRSPIQIVEVELPAGASVAYEGGAKKTNLHQQILLRKGRIEIAIGDHTYTLTEDDCLAMQLDLPVAFRNPTKRPARYYVIIASVGIDASLRCM